MTRVRRPAGATFRSLHVRNYRLFFSAQLISVSGTWMQTVAQAFLVLKLAPHARAGVDLIGRHHGRQRLRQIPMNRAIQFTSAIFRTGSVFDEPLPRLERNFNIETPVA